MRDSVIAGCEACGAEKEIYEDKFNVGMSLRKKARLKLSAHASHCSGDFTDTYIEGIDK
jgi:hypothetical protein